MIRYRKMAPMTSKPSDSKDGREPEQQPEAVASEEATCTEQQDCAQADASDSSTATQADASDSSTATQADASDSSTAATSDAKVEEEPSAAAPENAAGSGEPALQQPSAVAVENVSSVESSIEIPRPAAAVDSSDSDQCCGGAAAMSADDRRETADIIGAAAQLLSVGVHLLKAVARDQPVAEATSELQVPPGEGTRLVHAVKEFLINPELLQPELAAAEIMREVNRPRRRQRRLPLQLPGETRGEYARWLICAIIVFLCALGLFIYLLYATYYIFVEPPSKPY